jgi:hypothetical protein
MWLWIGHILSFLGNKKAAASGGLMAGMAIVYGASVAHSDKQDEKQDSQFGVMIVQNHKDILWRLEIIQRSEDEHAAAFRHLNNRIDHHSMRIDSLVDKKK